MREAVDNVTDRKEEWFNCPSCHGFMLPLRDYEIQRSSESPTVGAEMWEFLLWGWMAFIYNYAYDAITYKERQRKVATAKQEVLPQFPKSHICPHCLHVMKRL